MKTICKIIFPLFATLLLLGCTTATPTPRPANDDDDDGDVSRDEPDEPDDDIDGYDLTESWEFLPFYGELRFDVVDAETGTPITTATLQIENMPYANDLLLADENGRIIFHQLEQGITYVGDGPPPPTFQFAAAGYTPRQLSIEVLGELSGVDPYDPYNDENLTIIEVETEGGHMNEMPLYEMTIQLSCMEDCS